mgnify:CR=1 FL=1|tara:strand:- start:277 stop:498 length:222 start_codon:yes stop_codon:yes gene_type:complete
MKNNIVLEQCLKTLNSKEFKEELNNFIKPISNYLFKEFSIYLLFFVFFILTSFLLHLGVLILLIRYNNNLNKL